MTHAHVVHANSKSYQKDDVQRRAAEDAETLR